MINIEQSNLMRKEVSRILAGGSCSTCGAPRLMSGSISGKLRRQNTTIKAL
jgi:hypothetical protein